MTKDLYNQTESYIRYAQERYSQDGRYYDSIYRATRHILEGDYKKAQKELDYIEKESIKRAGKKSIWYKYRKD